MSELGTLKRVSIREVWEHEALEFTPWLAQNIKGLGAALGMELELVDQEASVGDFSLDLLAKDLNTGQMVVIENQFGVTDHDHLGKLLTYAAGFDARTIVWIGEVVREEHRQALDWLNRRSDSETQFFAVVIELLKIDDSRPAYDFRPVVFPNEWQKTRKLTGGKRAVTPRGEAYREYFQALIDELRQEHSFTGATKGQPQNWYSFASGTARVSYVNNFAWDGRVRAELYIDPGAAEDNLEMFRWFQKHRATIEGAFEEAVEWESLEDRRACRIAVYRPGSIDAPQSELAEIRSWSIDRLLKLKEVFGPLLEAYGKEPS